MRMLAVAVLPVPDWTEVTGFVVLVNVPGTTPVTLTVMVQVPVAGTVPRTKETTPVPAVAVGAPPHVFTSPLGLATNKPIGRLSTRLASVMATALGLRKVSVRVVTPFKGRTA